ncbi:PTS sugar transporter subunit IIA [Bombilactobacillus bombi]|uniref:PTS sugar transporter subunit IIA n=1 Tax=Bombilactobacillus bombi TaxID=1303590 RepID=UPI0015E5DC03|nr:PTS system fructose subfamily transporter subunit IIA [Bombilactobacillus bombi]MBA1434132.1 PTS system fructose subfamily transporter subunit IIA [Bombilactobacillus bombi]
MRQILLASHSKLAEGMMKTIEMFFGKQNNLYYLCAYTQEDYDLKAEIEQFLNTINKDDEIIVITDLFGGSVNNQFFQILQNKLIKKFYLISGMNLPLLLTLLTDIDNDKPINLIIRNAVSKAQQSIIFDNDKLSNEKEQVEEDF